MPRETALRGPAGTQGGRRETDAKHQARRHLPDYRWLGQARAAGGAWPAEHGAQHLVLVSRSGLPSADDWRAHVGNTPVARRIHAVRRVEAQGAAVDAIATDTADAEQMEALFERLRRCGRKLRGSEHTLVAFRRWRRSRPSRPAPCGRCWPPRWPAHGICTGFRAMRSWISSYSFFSRGDLGLAWVGALCRRQPLSGCPGTLPPGNRPAGTEHQLGAVFGPGHGGCGRAGGTGVHRGIEPVPVEQALELMGALVSVGVTQRTVAAVDWQVFRPVYETRGGRSFLQHIAGPQAARLAQTGGLAHDILEQLRDALPGQRRDLLRDYVRR